MANPDDIRNVAWLGNAFFQPHLGRLGLDCRRIHHDRPMALTWGDVCERTGFEPDLAIYADTSRPAPFVGLEDWPCLTGFYAIDTHIHAWYPFYAQAFDFVGVSLKGHMGRFRLRHGDDALLWIPPAAQDAHQPDWIAPKEWDLLFAGNVDKGTTPKRHAFLQRLGERVPGLAVRKGRFAELFPRARLALNIAERGDLNFRVFEALACGACLLTPTVAHGFGELFEPGRHLFTYDPRNMDGLAALVEELLAHPARVERVARAGHALVDANHRFANRAGELFAFVRRLGGSARVAQRRAQAERIRRAFLQEIFLQFADAYKQFDFARKYLDAAVGRAGR
jgi:hypothetical protein